MLLLHWRCSLGLENLEKIGRHFPVREKLGNFEQTGKPGKIGRHFPVREKLGNFEQTGKVRENRTKYWKKSGNFRHMLLCYF